MVQQRMVVVSGTRTLAGESARVFADRSLRATQPYHSIRSQLMTRGKPPTVQRKLGN